MRVSFHDRFWSVIAHIPIVTIIWTGYMVYCKIVYDCEFFVLLQKYQSGSLHSLPITPIVLTLLSVPIALGIQRMQKAYPCARNNAHQAYLFNMWLLQSYAIALCIAALGLYFNYQPVLLTAALSVLFIGFNCLVQATLGIVTAWKGRVYRYWRLGFK